MNRSLITAKNYNVEVISLSLVKSFLRVDGEQDDQLITFLLNAVIDFAEEKLGIVIGKKDYEYQVEEIGDILLPKKYIVSVNSVKIGGVDINFTFLNGIVKIKENTTVFPITINFTAENVKIDNDVKMALLRHVFLMYENRSTEGIKTHDIDSIYQSLISNNYNL